MKYEMKREDYQAALLLRIQSPGRALRSLIDQELGANGDGRRAAVLRKSSWKL